MPPAERNLSEAFGPTRLVVGSHIAADSHEEDLLVASVPYAPDVSKARVELARSQHDHDGDGVCDDRACASLRSLLNEALLPAAAGAAIAGDLDQVAVEH